MFVVGTIGKFEPVIFTIHSSDEESENEEEFDDVTPLLTLEQFCRSVKNSGKSLEETWPIMEDYHSKLKERRFRLNTDVHLKEEKLKELQGGREALTAIRDQIEEAVRFVERKLFLLSRAMMKRMKACEMKLRHKQLLHGILQKITMKNEKMQAEVHKLHRHLSLTLRRRQRGGSRVQQAGTESSHAIRDLGSAMPSRPAE